MGNSITIPVVAHQMCALQIGTLGRKGIPLTQETWNRNTFLSHIIVKYCNIILNWSPWPIINTVSIYEETIG